MTLNNKISLVTGGTRGIGREVALALAKEGSDVAISYTSNEELALNIVEEIKNLGVNSIAVEANVANNDDVVNMIKTVEEKLGTIDILVNNAGITKDNILIKMSEEDWDSVLDVNLKGVFLCSKAIARAMMKKRYGKIINISSVVGINGNPGQSNYSASKAGVIGFTKSIAKELASRGIRINAIAPGFIETDMTNALKDEIKNEMMKNIPLNSFGQPKDIAHLVLFLASEKSDYITGEVIKVDGGMGI